MKIIRTIPLVFLVTLMLHSCAKQTVPTGGPKDTIPPEMISVFPSKNTVNFTGNKIEMTFNEFVNLDNPKEQILITPDVGKKFDIVAKKKKVELTFEEKLKDSVTYSVNFREAVKDITEKNPAENLKIAFSTGTYIDSLSIKGIIRDPLQNKEIKNATVAIYDKDTFNIFAHAPSYISRSNEKGVFILENLKPGKYYVYAFNDANRNLVVDSRTEAYAFDTTAINLKRNSDAGVLNFIRLDSRPIKLTSARPYNTYFNIKFSKPLDQYRLTSTEVDTLSSILGEDLSSIKVYKTFDHDSLAVRVMAIDSLSQRIDTTVFVKFSERKSTPESFQLSSENWRLLSDKNNLEGTLIYNKPIASVNFDSITFTIDSANVVSFGPSDLTWLPKTNRILLSKTLGKKLPDTQVRPDRNDGDGPPTRGKQSGPSGNQIKIGAAAFISVESDSSQTIQETLKPLGLEETGVIRVNVQTNYDNFVVELLDKSFKVVRRIRNISAISFEDLPPADYQLRLIIDSDKDGRWSPGNALRKQQTESIRYYLNEKKSTIISLKANWEIGPLLISY